jgi:hypothetical protein
MRYFLIIPTLLLLTLGFQNEKPRPAPPSKKPAPTVKQAQESGLNNATPLAAWRSLIAAMLKKDEKKITDLMTPAGMKCMKDLHVQIGDNLTFLEFLRFGAIDMDKDELRWKKQTKDTAKGNLGPVGTPIYFKKTLQGWKFDKLVPVDR